MALRTIYPCYFDVSLTRKEGRRVAKSEAVPQPNLSRLARAAKSAGLAVAEEDTSKSHPARWFAREGRLVIDFAGSKEELLHKIASAL
ncbi:signal recognition particle subunit SRP19/SEC65 family protein [Methanocorpusculaceae archaeon]|nr:signal recognition particle subunit SRP19/SEC65 family protein [Methanocorpusculaceae archaeon]